jgi:DNA repair protein RecO (recombination protein O)
MPRYAFCVPLVSFVPCFPANSQTQIVSTSFQAQTDNIKVAGSHGVQRIRHGNFARLRNCSMPLYQSDAIILKTYPLGEADRIVVFFTRDHGKLRGVANGARRMKNRFGASLEPLAHSRLMFSEKENRELVRIQSADLLDSSLKVFQEYDRAVLAGHVIELVDRFLPEHEPHDAVFRLVRMTVRAIEQGCPINFAACYFEVWMLRLAGVFPDLFVCSACSRRLQLVDDRFFAPGLQAVICGSCDHRGGVGILNEVVELLHWILTNPLKSWPVPGETGASSQESGDRQGFGPNLLTAESWLLAPLQKALNNLHELNQYWIRQYSER